MPEIIRDIQQGTDEWLALRRGIPTASCFGQILTGSTLKPSAQATAYRYSLIASYFGAETPNYTNEWMDRGIEMEAEARNWYAFETDTEPEEVAFVYGGTIKAHGASPDSLIGDDGVLEIKCPKPGTHVKYLLGKREVPNEYKPQVYGLLYVTERKWVDFISYCPNLDPFMVRITSGDEAYLRWETEFRPALDEFIVTMITERAALTKEAS